MSGLRIIVRFGERKAKVDSLVAGTSDVEDVLKSIRREHLFSQINENTSLDTLSLYLDGKEQDRFQFLSENDKNKEFELKQIELNAEETRLRNKNSIISNVTTIDRLHLTEDKSADIQHELKARHNIIPDFNQLANFISQPLPTKIPLQRNKYQQLLTRYSLSNMVMEQIFVAHDEISCERLYDSLIPILFKPPTFSTTEDSFHGFWDAIIKSPLELFRPEMEFDRNTSKGTSTGNSRPDFIGRLDGIAIFRGEEKGVENSNENPEEELISKLEWSYDGIPYIFAYHAKTRYLTFDAICKNSDEALAISKSYDLTQIENRFSVFTNLFNISTILPTLVEMCSSKSVPEFKTLTRENGITVEFFAKKISKRYPNSCAAMVNNIVSIYQKIANVPFINNLQNTPRISGKRSGHLKLEFSPVGLPFHPRTFHELLIALRCVLTALKGLHELGIIHRDIRWPNVIKYSDRNAWFLIDFDDASFKPTQPAKHLNNSMHAPEIGTAGHTEAVDMWGVGLLIAECQIPIREAQIDDFKNNLLSAEPEARYTADAALKQVENIHKKCCHNGVCEFLTT